jgi:hypothetical protein
MMPIIPTISLIIYVPNITKYCLFAWKADLSSIKLGYCQLHSDLLFLLFR